MKQHINKADAMDRAVFALQGFRNFLQYHIKCSKALFHSRMRARISTMTAHVNRAKPDVDAQARTMSGRTFVRRG
jgi:actin related protein 2/3 complex, subunit 2